MMKYEAHTRNEQTTITNRILVRRSLKSRPNSNSNETSKEWEAVLFSLKVWLIIPPSWNSQYLAPGWLAEDWFCISNFLFSLSSSAKIATLFLFWKPKEKRRKEHFRPRPCRSQKVKFLFSSMVMNSSYKPFPSNFKSIIHYQMLWQT